jgi:glutamate racemase
MDRRSIGVFDSGMGGISTLIELKKILPNENFIYYGDSENAPYGTKTNEEILKLTMNVAEKLIAQNIKAMVVACNTATSVAVKTLREKYKDLIIIGVEPALKLAIDAGAKNILVMATNTTLREKKFNELANKYSDIANVIKLPCPELVQIAENGKLNNDEICKKQIRKYLTEDMDGVSDIDAVVLGCTHFIFYKKYIKELLNSGVFIIDGNLGTANHLKKQLKDKNLLNKSDEDGAIEFGNSQIIKNDEINKLELSKEIFNTYY